MAQQKAINQPQELGNLINWYFAKDIDQVIQKSKTNKKPILILFQEIPGCQGCKDYGDKVLSSNIICQFIADHFIPIAIYNNRAGQDAEILKKFNEPSWNYPVLRIVDHSMNNIADRLDKVYTVQGVMQYLQKAVQK